MFVDRSSKLEECNVLVVFDVSTCLVDLVCLEHNVVASFVVIVADPA